MGAIIAAIIIFFLTVGIPLFVNLSGAVGKMMGGGRAEEENDAIEFSNIEITTIPEATNSAELEIAGTVSNLDNLSVYLNGQAVQKLSVSGKSEFNAKLSGLETGTNEIYVSGLRKDSKNVRESQKYTVVYRAGNPTLEISSPGDNTSTPRDEIQVIGKTDTGSGLTVRVNGQPTVLSSDGTFKSSMRLKEGENKITVRVSDNAGNSEEKTVTVKYEK